MQITFSPTVAVIQQICYRGNDTDELLTFNSRLQMESELCVWLVMPGNKWGNHEHPPFDSSIMCMCDISMCRSLQSSSNKFIHWAVFFKSYVSWSMNEGLQQPQPHHWDNLLFAACDFQKRNHLHFVCSVWSPCWTCTWMNSKEDSEGCTYKSIIFLSLGFSLNREPYHAAEAVNKWLNSAWHDMQRSWREKGAVWQIK